MSSHQSRRAITWGVAVVGVVAIAVGAAQYVSWWTSCARRLPGVWRSDDEEAVMSAFVVFTSDGFARCFWRGELGDRGAGADRLAYLPIGQYSVRDCTLEFVDVPSYEQEAAVEESLDITSLRFDGADRLTVNPGADEWSFRRVAELPRWLEDAIGAAREGELAPYEFNDDPPLSE